MGKEGKEGRLEVRTQKALTPPHLSKAWHLPLAIIDGGYRSPYPEVTIRPFVQITA